MEERSPRARSNEDRVAFLSRLARGLAHEIKNPLSTMAINLALLQEDWERAGAVRSPEARTPREERSLKRIRTLQNEVRRLENILEEFLKFARGGEVNRSPHDLARIVEDLLEFVEPEDAQAGIRHHTDLPFGMPLVLVDEDQIKQAVLNLLVNARQAMPEGGELIVRMRRLGNEVELSITDTGVGMTEEQQKRCFEEYWSDKKGGTGLGLSTVKRIVEEHAGSVTVVSEVGQGSSFCMYLPLAVELTGATRGGDEEESDPQRAQGAKGAGAAPAGGGVA